MSMRVAGAAAQDCVATHHGPPTPPTFRLVEVLPICENLCEKFLKYFMIILK